MLKSPIRRQLALSSSLLWVDTPLGDDFGHEVPQGDPPEGHTSWMGFRPQLPVAPTHRSSLLKPEVSRVSGTELTAVLKSPPCALTVPLDSGSVEGTRPPGRVWLSPLGQMWWLLGVAHPLCPAVWAYRAVSVLVGAAVGWAAVRGLRLTSKGGSSLHPGASPPSNSGT